MRVNESLLTGKFYRPLFYLLLVVGLGMRAYQYFMGRSLWEDECHLALNLMNYGFVRLAQPLDYIQAAPILFIWTVKLIISVFGDGELAFRFFSFFCSVISLPLVFFVARELSNSRLVATVTFFLFCINVTLIYFSAEFKQYPIDLSVYLLLVYITLSNKLQTFQNRTALFVIVSCFAIFYSNVSVIVLFCIFCWQLFLTIKTNTFSLSQFKFWLPVLGCFLVNYFLFIYNHPSTLDQKTNYAFAFMPLDLFNGDFPVFMNKTIEETFFTMVLHFSRDFHFEYIVLLFFILGVFVIFYKKQYNAIFLAVLPIVVHLLLSSMKMYPFWYRLILYLVPCFLFIVTTGLTSMVKFCFQKIHFSLAAIVLTGSCYFLSKDSFALFPQWPTEIKSCLQYVNDSIAPGTHVYVTDPEHAYEYYNRRGKVNKPIFVNVNWFLDPPEFYELVNSETKPYILFYGTVIQWGYGDILDDLKKNNLAIKNYEADGYGVMLIKPKIKTEKTLYSLNNTYFDPKLTFTDENLIAIWSGEIISKPVFLPKGRYKISVLSRGTACQNIFPAHKIYIGDIEIGEFSNFHNYSRSEFEYVQQADSEMSVKIRLINDASDKTGDRNSFIKLVEIFQQP